MSNETRMKLKNGMKTTFCLYMISYLWPLFLTATILLKYYFFLSELVIINMIGTVIQCITSKNFHFCTAAWNVHMIKGVYGRKGFPEC